MKTILNLNSWFMAYIVFDKINVTEQNLKKKRRKKLVY